MSLLSKGVLPEVRYGFTAFDCPEAEWRVRRFHLAEGLSEPYQLVLELVSTDIHVDVPSLLGSACQLSIARDASARSAFGLVQRVETTGLTPDHIGVRVELAPAFTLLSQVVNTRFWQGKSTVEILKEVLTAPLQELGRTLRLDLDESAYEAREYCVQYRENDFDFASRLMQEEGIIYYFDHAADDRAEVLVLVAVSSDCPALKLGDDLEAVPLVPESAGTRHTESVHHFGWCSSLRSTSVAQRDFDWLHPADSPYERERRSQDARSRDREVYEHDDRLLLLDDGERRARRKLEEHATSGEVGRGESDVLEFVPGHQVSLVGHPQAELDRAYLLTRVVHTGDAPDASPFAQGAGGGPRYANTFECIPTERPFQPLRWIPRPRAYGPQTAIVVGPEGEDIHTDKQGRIKVLFHWDRLSPRDDTASCWIRVTQKWAGPGWGFMFLPRIGMEVLVEFLDGDPDRPVVTGCIYNGVNPTPYPLPDQKTKSTIKSESSLGGGGSNEIRFEDLKGSEEIFIHAQKDMSTVVENNYSLSVTGNQSLSIQGKPKAKGEFYGSSTSITGDHKLSASKTSTITAPDSIKLECGGSSIELMPGKITITAGGMASITLDVNALIKSAAGSTVMLDAGISAVSNGGGQLKLDANALIQGSGGGTTLHDANVKATGTTATLESTAGGKLALSANAELSGATTSCSSPAASLKLSASAAEISGPEVKSSALATNTITGAMIKLN